MALCHDVHVRACAVGLLALLVAQLVDAVGLALEQPGLLEIAADVLVEGRVEPHDRRALAADGKELPEAALGLQVAGVDLARDRVQQREVWPLFGQLEPEGQLL